MGYKKKHLNIPDENKLLLTFDEMGNCSWEFKVNERSEIEEDHLHAMSMLLK